jgi:hypothetical protein
MYDSNRIYNITNNTYYNPGGYTQSPVQKKIMVAISIFSVLFVGALLIFNVFSSTRNSYNVAEEKKETKQHIEAATAVLGANGPQVWKIVTLTTGHDDHQYAFIREDAVTRKVIQMDTLSGKLDWVAYREHPYEGAKFYSCDAYCFLIYDNKSKIKAYSAASGQLVWDEKSFPQHFPEFKSTIVEIDAKAERYRRFYINAGNGFTYYYFADNDTVLTNTAFDNRDYNYRYRHALKDTSWFSFDESQHDDGYYANLYRVNATISRKDPYTGYLLQDDYARFLQTADKRKREGVATAIQITPQVHYFKPDRLYQDGKRVLMAYHSDANEKGPLLVSLVNADGSIVFTSGGKDTELLRPLLSSYSRPIYYQDRLFFYKQGEEVGLAVLNLKTGKVDLQYKQDNNSN